jgi:tetratricopeptide (TPR) repeat protein
VQTPVTTAEEQVRAGSYKAAAETLRSHLATNGRDAIAWERYAGVLISLGRYQEALEATSQCLSLGGRSASPYRLRAIAFRYLGEARWQRESAVRAAELAPDDVECLILLADSVLAWEYDVGHARRLTARAHRLDESHPLVLSMEQRLRTIRLAGLASSGLALGPAGLILGGVWFTLDPRGPEIGDPLMWASAALVSLGVLSALIYRYAFNLLAVSRLATLVPIALLPVVNTVLVLTGWGSAQAAAIVGGGTLATLLAANSRTLMTQLRVRRTLAAQNGGGPGSARR